MVIVSGGTVNFVFQFMLLTNYSQLIVIWMVFHFYHKRKIAFNHDITNGTLIFNLWLHVTILLETFFQLFGYLKLKIFYSEGTLVKVADIAMNESTE